MTADFISPSKSEDPGSNLAESQRRSKLLFKLGRSKQDTPSNMQVIFSFFFSPAFCQKIRHAEMSFPQITVTTERIEDLGEVSINESEFELQKIHTVPRISGSEVREGSSSPDSPLCK